MTATTWRALQRALAIPAVRAAALRLLRVVGAEVELRDVVLLAGLVLLYLGLRDAVAESVARVVVGAILIALAVVPAATPAGRDRSDDGTSPPPARRPDARGRP
jgi:hypothetical protein